VWEALLRVEDDDAEGQTGPRCTAAGHRPIGDVCKPSADHGHRPLALAPGVRGCGDHLLVPVWIDDGGLLSELRDDDYRYHAQRCAGGCVVGAWERC
jgi:hypothetical protein